MALVATRRVEVGPGVKMLDHRSSTKDAMIICRGGGVLFVTGGGLVLADCVAETEFRTLPWILQRQDGLEAAVNERLCLRE